MKKEVVRFIIGFTLLMVASSHLNASTKVYNDSTRKKYIKKVPRNNFKKIYRTRDKEEDFKREKPKTVFVTDLVNIEK